jgi:ribonuclease HII
MKAKGLPRKTICGLDEAGRGALAGPLVLAAVVMVEDFDFGLVRGDVVVRDSKKLSERQRMRVLELIEGYSLAIATEVIPVDEINRKGIGWANMEGFRRLIQRLEADRYVVDGRGRLTGLGERGSRVTFMIDADETNPMALSAGIVAKVTRDGLMRELDKRYPLYRWRTNTGHGTLHHIVAIEEHGTCRFHRQQFVQTALSNFRAQVMPAGE